MNAIPFSCHLYIGLAEVLIAIRIFANRLMANAPSAGMQTLARVSLGPAPIGWSKGYILRDTTRLLEGHHG